MQLYHEIVCGDHGLDEEFAIGTGDHPDVMQEGSRIIRDEPVKRRDAELRCLNRILSGNEFGQPQQTLAVRENKAKIRPAHKRETH